MNMMSVIYGLLGGAVGVGIRLFLIQFAGVMTLFSLPIPTLAANVIGSFIAGLFFQQFLYNETAYVLVLVGMCGGLTTMSTCALESYLFMAHGYYVVGIANAILNVGLSIAFVALGFLMSKV